MTELETKLHEVRGHSIANEQYGRVCVFGLREDAGENCEPKVFDLVTKKLGRRLNDQDIEVAHRRQTKQSDGLSSCNFEAGTSK